MSDLNSRLGPSKRPQSAEPYSRGPIRSTKHFVKHDQDGDMSMSGSNNQGLVEVSITGWKNAESEDSVLAFLKRKVERPVHVKNTRYEGDAMIVAVPHFGQANTLLKLSGIRFAGDKLVFKVISGQADNRMPVETQKTSAIDVLTTLLSQRYNPQMEYLNLDSLDQDPLMIQSRLDGLGAYKSRIGPVICKLIGEKYSNVKSISFANNKIKSLMALDSLPQRIPNLVNLSFQDNLLGSYRDVQCLPGKDFTCLRELVLSGNPIQTSSSSKPGGDLRYRTDMKKIFPSIQILDQLPIVEIKFDFGTTVQLAESKGAFVDSPATLQTVNDFCARYFQLFDYNRPALADLYDSNSSFSLSINTVTRSNKREDWGEWWNLSRNLSKLSNSDKRLSLIKHGADIPALLNRLPQTVHELMEPNVIVDSYQRQLPSGLVIMILMVHGHFIDKSVGNHKRSFDRVFCLAPCQPGSKSALAGYPFTIINDELVLRTWISKPSWSNIKSSVSPAEIAMIEQLKHQQQLNDVQCQMIVEFMKMTNLNANYSWQCLSQTGWNNNSAMQAFESAKLTLPRDAFRNL